MWSAQAACAMQEQQTCQRWRTSAHGSNHDSYTTCKVKTQCSFRVLRHARFARPAGVYFDLVRATKNEVRAKEQTVTARVNSSEPSYRVPVRRATPNTNHSHHSEILADALRLLRGEVEAPADGARDHTTSLVDKVFLGCEVRGVHEASAGQPSSAGWRVCGVFGPAAAPFEVLGGTVVVCTNRRLGVPRSLTLPGETDFLGAVRRGLAGDCEDMRWRGQRVVSRGIDLH